MNDAMNIRKVLSPLSPTQRVGRLKKEYPDSQKRQFERDLEEQKDGGKDEKQDAPAHGVTSATDGNVEEKNRRSTGNRQIRMPI